MFLFTRGLSVPNEVKMQTGQGDVEAKDDSAADTKSRVLALELATNLNLALCHLKLDNLDLVIEFSTKVRLALDGLSLFEGVEY